jgi:hypothetical protein
MTVPDDREGAVFEPRSLRGARRGGLGLAGLIVMVGAFVVVGLIGTKVDPTSSLAVASAAASVVSRTPSSDEQVVSERFRGEALTGPAGPAAVSPGAPAPSATPAATCPAGEERASRRARTTSSGTQCPPRESPLG